MTVNFSYNSNSDNNDVEITIGIMEDVMELQQLFVETVTRICSSDYNEDQIEAWVSGVKNTARWHNRIEEQFLIVAKISHKIVGFGSLDFGNYVDMLYVHKDYQGRGIATKLYDQLQKEARRQGRDYIYAQVSKTAKGFFTAQGFKTDSQQTIIRNNIALINFQMSKMLDAEEI